MFTESIHKLIQGEDLTAAEMESTMTEVLDGNVSTSQIGSFLTALRMKGETVDEIAAVAETIRSRIPKLETEDAVLNIDRDDINIEAETRSKTGDMRQTGTKTFSISTATAFVVAAGDVKAIRHGHRAMTERMGISDVLENMGINLDISRSDVVRCIHDINIGFFAGSPVNGAMKTVSRVREEIGIRTIFNDITPIINPACASRHFLGVYRPDMTVKMARVLDRVGAAEAMVVCGEETFDEISICGVTRMAHLKGGQVHTRVVEPEEFGFQRVGIQDIKGEDAQKNAAVIREILAGEKGPRRDVVLLNAAAAFFVAGKDNDIETGIERAKALIDSGKARKKLDDLVQLTEGCRPFLRKAL